MNPCIYCATPSSHHTLFICDIRIKTRKCAPKVQVEIVMQGAAVRKARELHEIRRRAPRSFVGFLDLGVITS